MKKPKMGRPKLPRDMAKASMLTLRLTGDERATIDRAAESAGVRVSDWARRVLLSAST